MCEDTDAAALEVFERKVLRKIFGAVTVGGDYRIRANRKLIIWCRDLDDDIFKSASIRHLRVKNPK